MYNTVTTSEIKRRGMAAIENGLRKGPVHILKRNKPAAVIVSETDWQRLNGQQPARVPGLTAMQWLLSQPRNGTREQAEIDAEIAAERDW